MRSRGKRVIAGTTLLGLCLAALTVGSGASAKQAGAIARVTDTSGQQVGTVKFTRQDGGDVKVKVTANGLTAGFHGIHVHSVGVCDPTATDTGGNPSPFFTAGGHYNPVTTNIHGMHAGDMPPLLVTEDGSAKLIFVTDRFKVKDLLADDGSAVIFHAAADNLAHIPATTSTGGERYHSHVDDVFGPDTATKGTGDAGARFGCGIVTKDED